MAAVRALGAAGAGVATVAAAGVILEAVDTSEAPPFASSFSGVDRWDQMTFLGRYKKMYSGCNPLLLTYSSESLLEAKEKVNTLKARVQAGETNLNLSPEENEEMWKLKQAVDMSFNPSSGELTPAPFRMSGILAFNGPVCVAMLLSTSTAGVLFWAWANQSHNAMMNYYNRGASGSSLAIDVDWDTDVPRLFREIDIDRTGHIDRSDIKRLTTRIMGPEIPMEKLDAAMSRLDLNQNGRVTLEEFTEWFERYKNDEGKLANKLAEQKETESMLKSYGLAVTLALGVSFGLSLAIQKRYPPERAKQLLKYVAFPSTAAASTINCYVTLAPSIPNGFPLLDSKGNLVANGETSVMAAEKGVNQTTISRMVIPMPVFLFPPIAMAAGPIATAVAANPALGVPITCYLTMLAMGFGLPLAISVFPQIGEIDVADIEDKFKGIKNHDGQVMTKFYYDKGL